MPVRVNLPHTGKDNGKRTGAYGLDFPDGATYTGRPGGSVVVEDHHAAQINTSSNGRLGLISATLSMSVGTKAGRVCPQCRPRRVWQAWSVACPRCGHPTDPS